MKKITPLLTLIILVSLSASAFFFYQSSKLQNWKTYSGESFSFKYPENWIIEKSDTNQNGNLYLRLGVGKTTKYPEPFLVVSVFHPTGPLKQLEPSMESPTDTTLDGLPALRGQSNSDNSFITYIIKGTKTYAVSTVLDDTVPEIEQTYNQILSTFQFTN